jgi:hypothetical protein
MKYAHTYTLTLGVLLIGLYAICCNAASAAECAGKTVADCADALAKKVNDLQKENSDLQKELSDQAKLFDSKLDDIRKLIATSDKKVDNLANETAVIRPSGQGCLLARFKDIPPNYPTVGAFAFGLANAGQPFQGAGVKPFEPGAPLNAAFQYTHGLLVCAK